MTSPGAAGQTGVEWGGQPTDGDEAECPPLHPAERCDGENPMTSRPCVNGHHHGYHRDTTGAEWLDD